MTVGDEMDLDRLQKVLIFTLGALEELTLKGFVDRSPDADRLSPEGFEIFRALKASGFKTRPGETEAAVSCFRQLSQEDYT